MRFVFSATAVRMGELAVWVGTVGELVPAQRVEKVVNPFLSDGLGFFRAEFRIGAATNCGRVVSS